MLELYGNKRGFDLSVLFKWPNYLLGPPTCVKYPWPQQLRIMGSLTVSLLFQHLRVSSGLCSPDPGRVAAIKRTMAHAVVPDGGSFFCWEGNLTLGWTVRPAINQAFPQISLLSASGIVKKGLTLTSAVCSDRYSLMLQDVLGGHTYVFVFIHLVNFSRHMFEPPALFF